MKKYFFLLCLLPSTSLFSASAYFARLSYAQCLGKRLGQRAQQRYYTGSSHSNKTRLFKMRSLYPQLTAASLVLYTALRPPSVFASSKKSNACNSNSDDDSSDNDSSDDLSEIIKKIRQAEATQKFQEVDHSQDAESSDPDRPLTLKDYVGSIPPALQELVDVLKDKELRQIYKQHNLMPSTGVILYGPPGTGKTYLVRCLAGELEAPYELINSPDLISRFGGALSENIKRIFTKAKEAARTHPSAMSIICFDEINVIGDRRQFDSPSGFMKDHADAVNTLLTNIDGLGKSKETIVVIGMTNDLNALDPALIRSGRCETHISVDTPNATARANLLTHYLKRHNIKDIEKASKEINALGLELEGATAADVSKEIKEGLRALIRKQREEIIAAQNPKGLVAQARQLFGEKPSYTAPSALMVIEQIRQKKLLKQLPKANQITDSRYI